MQQAKEWMEVTYEEKELLVCSRVVRQFSQAALLLNDMYDNAFYSRLTE